VIDTRRETEEIVKGIETVAVGPGIGLIERERIGIETGKGTEDGTVMMVTVVIESIAEAIAGTERERMIVNAVIADASAKTTSTPLRIERNTKSAANVRAKTTLLDIDPV
jgi:hypothetical protein